MLPVIDELAKASARSKEREGGPLLARRERSKRGAFETRVDGSDYNYNATR